jgi:DNA polymerase III delta subunit
MNQQSAKMPAQFTLLMGDDTISREKMKSDIVAAIQNKFPDASFERFDPETMAFSSFTERMISPSLFQEVRIFLVRDAHALSRIDLDMLDEVFPYDLPDAFVVIETEKTRTKKTKDKAGPKDFFRWTEAFEQHAAKQSAKFAFAEFIRPPDYKMAEWVEKQTPLFLSRGISRKDAEYLVDLVGADSAALFSELQKIDIHLPPGKPISREAITSISGATRLMTQFECAQALGRKDFPRVLEIIESLYLGSVYLPLYISAIFKHFWALFRIKNYAQAHSKDVTDFQNAVKRFNKAIQDDIGLKIGMAAGLLSDKQRSSIFPVIIKSGIVDQALTFEYSDYKRIFAWLFDFDVGIKTGRIDDSKIGFQLLCYKIFKAGEIGDD